MRKLFCMVLACFLIFVMSGCGQTQEPMHEQQAPVESVPSQADSGYREEAEGSEATVESSYSFDFETKTVMLNSGYEMPIYGLGTYSLTGEVCVDSVSAALDRGVRLIDTAYMYHNEESVGEAVRNSGIPREEIFVITKLYPNQFSDPEAAIEAALEKLDIEYIDMMLLHHPGTGDVEAYLAMERAVADGKVRSLGLPQGFYCYGENLSKWRKRNESFSDQQQCRKGWKHGYSDKHRV